MTRSLGIELARRAVERRAPPRPGCARRTTTFPPRERVEVEGVQRVAEGEHDVVRHVDDVGDRAHPGRREARLEPQRATARSRRRGRAARCSAGSPPSPRSRRPTVSSARLARVPPRRRRELPVRRARRPRARSRRPTGSRAGSASSRSRAPPRRAGGRRPAACRARRARGGRGCRCGRVPSSSSRSERIIPSETLAPELRLLEAFVRPAGTAPGSATATVAPAPKFHAPQTIWRGSASPTSTRQSWSRSAFGCLPASSTRPTRKRPSCRPRRRPRGA